MRVLICDRPGVLRDLLRSQVEKHPQVFSVELADTVEEAANKVADEPDAIFIDPLALGLEAASTLILETRRNIPSTPFVLYLDLAEAERDRTRFYRGDRRRFSHYYTLDKGTPMLAFASEVDGVIGSCVKYFSAKERGAAVRAIASVVERSETGLKESEMTAIRAKLDALLARIPAEEEKPSFGPKSVFLSHRFAEQDYVQGLRSLLEGRGFTVVTGESANSFISTAILERIKGCQFFLVLMTRDQVKKDGTYTTSPWLLEEKGAALAFGKYLVILVEEGVTDVGGLQGDWQRHHFGPKSFLAAALKAAEQLATAAGQGKLSAS